MRGSNLLVHWSSCHYRSRPDDVQAGQRKNKRKKKRKSRSRSSSQSSATSGLKAEINDDFIEFMKTSAAHRQERGMYADHKLNNTLYLVQVRHFVVGLPSDDTTLRCSVAVAYHIQFND